MTAPTDPKKTAKKYVEFAARLVAEVPAGLPTEKLYPDFSEVPVRRAPDGRPVPSARWVAGGVLTVRDVEPCATPTDSAAEKLPAERPVDDSSDPAERLAWAAVFLRACGMLPAVSSAEAAADDALAVLRRRGLVEDAASVIRGCATVVAEVRNR